MTGRLSHPLRCRYCSVIFDGTAALLAHRVPLASECRAPGTVGLQLGKTSTGERMWRQP